MSTTEQKKPMTTEDALAVIRMTFEKDRSPIMTQADAIGKRLKDQSIERIEKDAELLTLAVNSIYELRTIITSLQKGDLNFSQSRAWDRSSVVLKKRRATVE